MKAFFLSLWQNDILRLALDSAFKLVLAAVCGGFIGYERQHSHRPAGFRTHILVAVGAALVMITSSFLTDQYQEVMQIDPTRMSAQVISGIGFLGAGTILREGFSVKGLTTLLAFGRFPAWVLRWDRASMRRVDRHVGDLSDTQPA